MPEVIREVLFELNNWTIENSIDHLVVRHACAHPPGGNVPMRAVCKVFVYPGEAQACWRCREPIPEGITSLYLMHEWDRL